MHAVLAGLSHRGQGIRMALQQWAVIGCAPFRSRRMGIVDRAHPDPGPGCAAAMARVCGGRREGLRICNGHVRGYSHCNTLVRLLTESRISHRVQERCGNTRAG